MSPLPGSLSVILPILVKLLRGPGKMLLIVHSALIALVLWLSISAVQDGHGGAWVPLVFGAIFAVAILVFAIRAGRLSRYVNELEQLQDRAAGQEIVTQDGRSTLEADARKRFEDASWEASRKTGKFMPRVEAAQRAAIAAAGGTVEAPYLKADLRVTLVSAMLAMAAGPAGFILLIATAIIT